MSRSELFSWGMFPRIPQNPMHCGWSTELVTQLQTVIEKEQTTLPYGSGLSYGDSCLAASNQVIDMRGYDRFISVDWSSGVLRANAGVTLDQILQVVIPKGWFLPVTPGTKYVTLGGAIANDVHGKNHHRRGTFGCHVRRIGLQRSELGYLECSTDKESDLFAATIGGLGLTGVIEWAEIELMPIQSSTLNGIKVRFDNIEQFFELSDLYDHQFEFSVSWVDCVARKGHLGRGIYMAADFMSDGVLSVDEPHARSVPLTPPISLVNRWSVRAFNEFYWRRAPVIEMDYTESYSAFFYPLDSLLQWNRIYGREGFQQYQCVIPDGKAQDGIRRILEKISEASTGSFLAVLKRCGDMTSPGLISFPLSGTMLALDFPQNGELSGLFEQLDQIVHRLGGRLYPAKDAHMKGIDFRSGYPQWKQLEYFRDPALLSHFWKRVMQ